MPAAFPAGATSHVQLKPNNMPIKHTFQSDSQPTVFLKYSIATKGPWTASPVPTKGKGKNLQHFRLQNLLKTGAIFWQNALHSHKC